MAILTFFCLEHRWWCLHGSLLMLAISTELLSEMEIFKVKYFRCFVWNWVENSRALIGHRHFSCSPPSFCTSSCADWALLFCQRSLNREYVFLGMIRGETGSQSCCKWGLRGDCAWKGNRRAQENPSTHKTQTRSLRKAIRKSLNAFDTSLVLTVVSSVYFCTLASGLSSGAETVCARKMAFCLRGQSQEHCVKLQHFFNVLWNQMRWITSTAL